MSQSPRACPVCGTSVPAGQRFCSNCGTNLDTGQPAGQPPSQYGGPTPQAQQPYQQAPYGQQYGQQGQQFGQQQYGQQFGQPVQPYQQPQKSNPIAEALGALGLLFFMRRFRPGYRPRRQSSGCCGCLVLLIILGIIFGIPGYVYYRAHPSFIQQLQNQIQHNSSGNNGDTPTTPPTILATTSINQTVPYSGVAFTIESAQQATSFTDDAVPTNTNGVVRVKFKEMNNSGQDAVYFFSDIYHLILPDKSSVAPLNGLQQGGIQNGVTRDNWVDFAVPTSDKIAQLTLVIGRSQEAQISIPLTGKANLSAFQDKTINPNTPISYASLNWTLQSATQSLSIAGKQASSGMRYVTLSFKVDNPTSNYIVIDGTQNYMRLMAGGVTNSPVDSTVRGINANTSGITGTVTFLMPENNTAYTLIFLAVQGFSSARVNTNLTI